MKKELRLALLVLLVLSWSVRWAFGQSTGKVEVDGVQWEYTETAKNSGKCAIKPTDPSRLTGEVKIPAVIEDQGKKYPVIAISDGAFQGASGITGVVFPSEVESIGNEAFSTCGLLKVEIPKGVTVIQNSVFSTCVKLETVTFLGAVTSIGEYAFNECSKLSEIGTLTEVTTIGASAFANCVKLKAVLFGKKLATVANGAFSGCTSIKQFSIPASATSIAAGAFTDCRGLTSFEVDKDNGTYCSEGGILFTKNKKTLVCYPKGLGGKYSIPVGVEELGENSFNSCAMLEGVAIPLGVKTIGDYAFANCTHLKEVSIPSSVESIGQSEFSLVFSECTELERIYLLAGVNCEVEENAFLSLPSTTLYVRKGMKDAFGAKAWVVAAGFKAILEGYVVSFMDEGAKLLGEQMVDADGQHKAVRPADPVKKGFTFKGWRKQGETKAFDFDKELIAGDMVLEPIWEASGAAPQAGKKSNKVDVFKWEDWIYFSFRDNKVVTVREPGKDNSWDIAFHITDFKTNGGASTLSGGLGAAVETPLEELKDEVSLSGLQWVMDVTGVGIKKTMMGSYDVNEPKNLSLSDKILRYEMTHMPPSIKVSKKVWLVRDALGDVLAFRITKCDWDMSSGIALPMEFEYVYLKRYTLAFDGNGADKGAMNPMHALVGNDVTLPKRAFERAGYVFAGWSKRKDAATADFLDGATVNPGGEANTTVTLYAVWQQKVLLTYDAAVVRVTLGGKALASGAEVKAADALLVEVAGADKVFEELKVNGAPQAGAVGKTSYTYTVQAGDGAVKVEARVKDRSTAPVAKVLLTYDAAVVRVTLGGKALASGAEVKAADALLVEVAGADKVFEELKVNGAPQAGAVGKTSYTYTVQAGDGAVKVEARVKGRDKKGTGVESVLLAGVRVVENPVGAALVLDGVTSAELVEVYSLTGTCVLRQQLRGDSRVTIGAGGLSAGVYVVRIAARDGAKALRIVKR